jgi:hypothetical protein
MLMKRRVSPKMYANDFFHAFAVEGQFLKVNSEEVKTSR